jgi:hypothetical protein
MHRRRQSTPQHLGPEQAAVARDRLAREHYTMTVQQAAAMAAAAAMTLAVEEGAEAEGAATALGATECRCGLLMLPAMPGCYLAVRGLLAHGQNAQALPESTTTAACGGEGSSVYGGGRTASCVGSGGGSGEPLWTVVQLVEVYEAQPQVRPRHTWWSSWLVGRSPARGSTCGGGECSAPGVCVR